MVIIYVKYAIANMDSSYRREQTHFYRRRHFGGGKYLELFNKMKHMPNCVPLLASKQWHASFVIGA
jgi:hypothetical protein